MDNQELYPCPMYFIALLREIDRVLKHVMYNINQEEYDSPFDNTGNIFESPVFKVEAYNWDTELPQDYNFIYYTAETNSIVDNIDNIKVSWYKFLGKDTMINQNLNPEILINVFNDCIAYLTMYETSKLNTNN